MALKLPGKVNPTTPDCINQLNIRLNFIFNFYCLYLYHIFAMARSQRNRKDRPAAKQLVPNQIARKSAPVTTGVKPRFASTHHNVHIISSHSEEKSLEESFVHLNPPF